MALAFKAGLGNPQSHASVSAVDPASLGPPMKKIKRTGILDWEDSISPKPTSTTPVPFPSVNADVLKHSGGLQSAQKLWKQQQEQQKVNEEYEEYEVNEPVASVVEDSGSEYTTSARTESEDDSESDSGAESRHIRSSDRLELTDAHGNGVAAQASHATTSKLVPSVPSDMQPSVPSSLPEKASLKRNFEDEYDASSVHRHLTPNELVAKIRRDSEIQQQRKSPNESEAQSVLPNGFMSKIGPHGELYTSEDGRFYCTVQEPNGGLTSSSSVPIPTGYKLHPDTEYPYICPVRDCRKLSPSIVSLSGHFSASHNKTTFNDNLDGTISRLGYYNRGPGQTSPGIIVSRKCLPPGAPPPALPSKPPTYKPRRSLATSRHSGSGSPRIETQNHAQEPTTLAPPSATSHNGFYPKPIPYLMRFLHPRQEWWQRPDIQHLQSLQRRRDIPRLWIEHHSNTLLNPNQAACALAYIVGDEVTEPGKKCSSVTYTTSRLSDRCIQLPEKTPLAACKEFSKVKTCVGCRYYSILQRQRNACVWSGEGWDESSSEHEVDSLDFDMVSMGGRERSPDDELNAMPMQPPVRAAVRGRSKSRTGPTVKSSTAVSENKDFQLNTAQFEMEEWEFAPGRILNKKQPPQNVAFSNSYLTSREPVAVSDDISFNVSVLSAGSTVHFSVENSKLRTCSVAAGKVKVRIGKTEFIIGPNGMFKVMPGESCVVENRHYVDAYVHCTTVHNYELAS